MPDLSSSHWPPTGISTMRRMNASGPIVLPPAHEHRVIVHVCEAIWSTCRSTGTRHLRQRGDIDVVASGDEGGYDAATAGETLEIRIPPGMLGRVASEMGRGNGQSALETRHLLRNDRIVHLAQALESDRLAGAPGGSLYADSIGVALAVQLLDLSKQAANSHRGLSSTQLQRLYDYVEAHLEYPLTIDVLARVAGASSSHLRLWFKAATGTTIHRYVVRRRLERARFLLSQGSLVASEVAQAAGFSHQSHMAHWMRRELGYTPRSLRLACSREPDDR